MDTSEIITAFLQAVGKWRGCCWPTQFGNGSLNLQDLRSSQAMLMARSTAGKERADWTAATRWLEQVEQDAATAEDQAELATELAIFGQFGRAWDHAQRACNLESQYKSNGVWQPLLTAITRQLQTTDPVRSQPNDLGPAGPDDEAAPLNGTSNNSISIHALESMPP